MSASATARAAIATALAGCEVNGKTVPVLTVAPPQLVPPCIVLEPHDPMLTRRTLTSLELGVEAVCIVPLTNGPGGFGVDLERLETLAEWVFTHWKNTDPASAPLVGEYAGAKVGLVTVPLFATITV